MVVQNSFNFYLLSSNTCVGQSEINEDVLSDNNVQRVGHTEAFKQHK